MAFAVNQALLALNKAGIFCTEPWRVPLAGTVSHCLFDKTGTLTTDQLAPVGVINAIKAAAGSGGSSLPPMGPIHQASTEAALVLGACHALVAVDGGQGLVGDPIESAAVRGLGWAYDPATRIAKPGGDVEQAEKEISTARSQLTNLDRDHPKFTALKEKISSLELVIKSGRASLEHSSVTSVRIDHRHHFSSKLQRMSVVATVKGCRGGRSGRVALVKGSPEALRPLLDTDEEPAWWAAAYGDLAQKGIRVLALAYRWLSDDDSADDGSRSWVESRLRFAGFVAFVCKTRSDSPVVIGALKESAHAVAMVTGDSALTALHVAQQVGICDAARPALLLHRVGNGVEWRPAVAEGTVTTQSNEPFSTPGVRQLSQRASLVVTEAVLEACPLGVWDEVDCIPVFARMSPSGKGKVIRAVQAIPGHHVLMCGDGGNDVGALKQAEVGLALLSGHGNTNTDAPIAGPDAAAGSEAALNQHSEELKKRQLVASKKIGQLMKEKRADLQRRVQSEFLQEELAARKARGEDVGVMGMFSATRVAMARMTKELKEEQLRLQREYGDVYRDKKSGDATAALESMAAEGEVGVVRPGDASIASPFTTRVPSVKSVVDLIRQGRCTLLSALQQQQIMMLECIVAAYTLSALSLEGARSSERQMMASSWLTMTASIAFSYSAPVDKMDPVRPLNSLFHPSVIMSTLGQALIHLYCMSRAVAMSTAAMGPAKLKEVVEFHKKAKAGELNDDADFWALWATPFLPNLLNTVVFLVETAQIIAVLFVNYRGRPWMKGVLENHPLILSVFLCAAGVAAAAWEISPEANALIHLFPFPDQVFRIQVMSLVAISLVGTFLWDRVVTAIFANHIFKAMLREALETRPVHLLPVVKTALMIGGGLLLLSTGNIFLIIGAIWVWRKMRSPS